MENNVKKTEINKVEEVEKRKGTAYDVKRFNAAVKAICETDLLNEQEMYELKLLAAQTKINYLEE